MDYKKAFYSKLEECYLGAKIKDTKDKSGFSNLLSIKERYFEYIKQILSEKIPSDDNEKEIYNKLYTFFDSYLNETGTPFFTDTPIYKNIYAKIYSNSKDTSLFYKTQNLYYVKSDAIYKNMTLTGENAKFTVEFNANEFRRSSDNVKSKLIFKFVGLEQGANLQTQTPLIKINVTNQSELFKDLKSVFKQGSGEFTDDLRSYKKQNEVDFFIHKDAENFLKEQFELWMFSHLYADSKTHKWQSDAIERLQKIRNIAFELIEIIAKFENELRAIWLKPKFAKNTQYVFTLDLIPNFDISLITDKQIAEWKELNLVDVNFTATTLKSDFEKYKFLPLDTKFLNADTRLKLLAKFENLDEILNGELVKSDNFATLNTLMPRYKGKIDLIYIDPPFNTGSDFEYKDRFQDATWLTLMQNRLEFAREILSERGSFCLHLDHNANYMGRMLLNDTFGKDKFINEIIWSYRSGGASKNESMPRKHDNIWLYSKTDSFVVKPLYEIQYYDVNFMGSCSQDENGKFYVNTLLRDVLEGDIKINKDGKTQLYSVKPVLNLSSEHLGFGTQKPEGLLSLLFEIANTDKKSIILDYHLGSGTSVAVAQKLGRKWLGVEMGEHFYSVIIPRLKKTLGGAQSGISKECGYKGGGAFRYFELESYEEALNECEYALYENGVIDYNKSRKLIKSLSKGEKVCLNMSGYRQNFDIFVSYANLIGAKIKRIFACDGVECAEFENGEIMQKDDIDMAKFPKIRDLIWWER